jgi:DNA topoisomerase-1
MLIVGTIGGLIAWAWNALARFLVRKQMTATKLKHVDDRSPGLSRRPAGKGWAYFDAEGQRVTDRDEIDRLNRVALPPAYTDAWFCPDPDGHIQATGIDARGRKQYRYHLDFRAQQEAEKYEKCADFGRVLSKLRAQVETDLAKRSLSHDTVVAAVVRLLDLGHIRIGNDEYAKENQSYGATTLQDDHATFAGGKLKLSYVGKSGKTQKLTINDRRLATVVKRTQDLPGQRLFQFVGDDGAPHPIHSHDVNDYIQRATGGSFTAKHFRTWGASLLAFRHIIEAGKGAKLKLKPMLESVAAALGNTPAISRKSYIHPSLVALCKCGDAAALCDLKLPRATRYMEGDERALIAFLDEIAELARAAPEAQAA